MQDKQTFMIKDILASETECRLESRNFRLDLFQALSPSPPPQLEVALYSPRKHSNYSDPESPGRSNRTRFSSAQLLALEDEFIRSRYLTRIDRIQLAERLGLTEKQVKIWFQNRRVRQKKDESTFLYRHNEFLKHALHS